jgi:hypothetical protein
MWPPGVGGLTEAARSSDMADKPQTFENHARYVPMFHFVATPILAINSLWNVYQLFGGVSAASIISMLVALALLIVAFSARLFALTVQDRVIRLEMSLRFDKLLPPDLRERARSLTPAQLVGLRFASDAELVDLTRRVLDDKIEDRTAIKKMIRHWQADHLRA